jgi:hypothetical protein
MCLLLVLSASADASCLPTASRLIPRHSFKGLVPRPPALAYTDLNQFLTSDGSSLSDPFNQQLGAALSSEGFVSGIGQLYNLPKHRRHKVFAGQGLSDAIQLRDDQQAAIEAAREHQYAITAHPNIHWKQFSVPAIPGSMGLLLPATRRFTGASNVYFSDGPYDYLVGESAPRGSGFKTVIRAATRLYDSVHGAAVCP